MLEQIDSSIASPIVPTKVALYARCSTKDKHQDTASQFMVMEDYCKRKGYQYKEEDMFEDYESGRLDKIKNRMGFRNMIIELKANRYDGLVLLKESRFARSVELGLRLEREIEMMDKFVEFAESGMRFDHCRTNPTQKAMLIFALIGGEISNMLHAADVKRGIASRKEKFKAKGKPWRWGRKPLTFKSKVTGETITLSLEGVSELRREGVTLSELARQLGCSRRFLTGLRSEGLIP